jgi:anti-sigma B factor antagonist
MGDLSIVVREVGPVSVVEPKGFINAHTVRQFEGALEEVVQAGRYAILLNCRQLNYISSAGLGAIMGLIETVRDRGGDIQLCNLQDNVFAIFDTLGFTQLYKVHSEEQDGLQAFPDQPPVQS